MTDYTGGTASVACSTSPPPPQETLKTRLQDVLAKARDCQTMAEGLQVDLTECPDKRGEPCPATPEPNTAISIVRNVQGALAVAQAALRDACETLKG